MRLILSTLIASSLLAQGCDSGKSHGDKRGVSPSTEDDDSGDPGDEGSNPDGKDDGDTTSGTDSGTSSGTGTGTGTGAGTGSSGLIVGDTLSAAHWFPSTMFFNQKIDQAPKAADSDATIAAFQARGWGNGKMMVDFSIDVFYTKSPTVYAPFLDGGVYKPDSDIPQDVPIPETGAAGFESSLGREDDGGDDHYIAVDVTKRLLFETFRASVTAAGELRSEGSVAIWPFDHDYPENLRGDVCTSADAGGFPIAPLLFSADEVAAGEINHAIRFILPNASIHCRTYVRPATHGTGPASCAGWAGSDGMPYGARLRLRADFPVDTLPSVGAKVVARAMQKYGIILADGGNVALTAQSDAQSVAKWADLMESNDLNAVQPSDFEMIEAGPRITFTSFDCVRNPP